MIGSIAATNLSTVPVRCDTEKNGTDTPEHEHEGDPPRDIGIRFPEVFCKIADRQGNGKEVESIPRPREKGNLIP